MATEFQFVDLVDNFPPFIPRTQVQKYFPWLSQKRLANLDCKGDGPPAIRNGRAIIYPTDALLSWLDSRNEDPRANKSGVKEVPDSIRMSGQEEQDAKRARRGRKRKWQEVRERRGLEV